MPKYEVKITEYLQSRITVEAEGEADAVSKGEENYNNEKEVLDYSDHTKTEIDIYNPNKFKSKLDLLMERIDKFNKDRDWDLFHTPVNLAESISIEANELLECYQWNDNANIENVKEELADVRNYCLKMSMVLGVEPIDIMNKKMYKTEKKYPIEKSKGVSTKFNKL
jgi:NTP pyrophosphatase (non-canonical NTP hydrolase)